MLSSSNQPAIIISASGMMEGGRILHHLMSRGGDPKNTILITGWQAPFTLGRQIVDGKREVKIFGEVYEIRAKVELVTGFSGHADREELLAWAGAMQKKPLQTFIVHGEEESANALAQGLRDTLGFENIYIPDPLQNYTI